jgi:zinc transporter
MNKVMFRFTWVATVFLPLGFITGLLGINVAGIPGEHDPLAFWLVCVSLIVLSIVWGIFATWITRPSKERAQRKEK